MPGQYVQGSFTRAAVINGDEVTPTTAFGFGTDESFNAMRWRFQGAPSDRPEQSPTPRPER